MWVEFVVGSHPCSKWFFPGIPVFHLSPDFSFNSKSGCLLLRPIWCQAVIEFGQILTKFWCQVKSIRELKVKLLVQRSFQKGNSIVLKKGNKSTYMCMFKEIHPDTYHRVFYGLCKQETCQEISVVSYKHCCFHFSMATWQKKLGLLGCQTVCGLLLTFL